MTIEIREIVIRSEVLERPAHAPGSEPGARPAINLARLRAELLAACRDLIERQLRNQQER